MKRLLLATIVSLAALVFVVKPVQAAGPYMYGYRYNTSRVRMGMMRMMGRRYMRSARYRYMSTMRVVRTVQVRRIVTYRTYRTYRVYRYGYAHRWGMYRNAHIWISR